MPPRALLTDVEHEFMEILWKLGEGTVHDVLAHLPEGRDLAYTSVSTILRILEQKGILENRKEGRAHIYRPLLARNAFAAASVSQVVDEVFHGKPGALAAYLIEDKRLTPEELDHLEALLLSRKGGRR